MKFDAGKFIGVLLILLGLAQLNSDTVSSIILLAIGVFLIWKA